MPNIFLSYRRSDSYAFSHQIYNELKYHFGENQIFIDDEKIPIGKYFKPYLKKMIQWADIFIVIVGNGWKGLKKDGSYKINDKFDYVRFEIEQALFYSEFNEIQIIPIVISPQTLSEYKFPSDFSFLSEINGLDFEHDFFENSLYLLKTRLSKFSTNGLLKPKLTYNLNQNVNIFQTAYRYGGATGIKFPKDSKVYMWKSKDKSKWEWEIISESDPSLTRSSFNTLNSFNKAIPECLGTLMEWYDVEENFYFWEDETGIKEKISRFLMYKKNGAWIKKEKRVAYTSLQKILKQFHKIISYYHSRGNMVYDNSPPEEGAELSHYYNRLGYFGANNSSETFGKYICSLTFELGGIDNENNLVSFPEIHETKLQYLDYYSEPFFQNINFCGHVGLNQYGYHIAFIM